MAARKKITRGSFVVGNGQQKRFWEDSWLGENTLAIQYPNLYNIARLKNVLVEDVLSSSSPN